MRISVTFLLGSSIAHNADRSAEYPVSPDRLLQAMLAAAWTRDDRGIAHREAIATLEGVKPTIYATPSSETQRSMGRYARNVESESGKMFSSSCKYTTTPVFVANPKAAPLDVHLAYDFDVVLDPGRTTLLREVLADVFYLGESSSPALLRLDDTLPRKAIVYKPTEWGDTIAINVPAPGRIATLDRAFDRRTAAVAALSPKLSPDNPRYGILAHRLWNDFRDRNDAIIEQGYRRVDEDIHSGWILIPAIANHHLPNMSVGAFDPFLADYRSAWLDSLTLRIPELTGHGHDGSPTVRPHVAFIPLTDVNRPFASGELQGVAVAVPRSLSQSIIDEAYATTQRTVNVRSFTGRIPIIDKKSYLAAVGSGPRPKLRIADAMQKTTSQRWATYTPAVPWRFPKRSELKDANGPAESILEMFDEAGLPRPSYLRYGPRNTVSGVANARSPQTSASRLPRAHHLEFAFDVKVHGPILLGRCLWKGYGACVPMS